MAESVRKAFIVGHPVAHSRSPLIHGHWLREGGISGTYERIDVAPERFEDFMHELPVSGFVGGNVTIPHKEAAFRLSNHRDDAAEAIGAANTLWLDGGSVCASNTDAVGFAADLDARAPDWRKASSILVLGAGGAARAVIFAALVNTQAQVHVVNRTVSRAVELAHRFGERVTGHGDQGLHELASETTVVVNTTSLGMSGRGGLPLDVSLLPPGAIVSDIVYTPLRTPFLAAASARGLVTVDGLGMLLHQAVPGFERWFGIRPVVTAELRTLVEADIERAA